MRCTLIFLPNLAGEGCVLYSEKYSMHIADTDAFCPVPSAWMYESAPRLPGVSLDGATSADLNSPGVSPPQWCRHEPRSWCNTMGRPTRLGVWWAAAVPWLQAKSLLQILESQRPGFEGQLCFTFLTFITRLVIPTEDFSKNGKDKCFGNAQHSVWNTPAAQHLCSGKGVSCALMNWLSLREAVQEDLQPDLRRCSSTLAWLRLSALWDLGQGAN